MSEATTTPEAPTTELLPCPFCGHEPAISDNGHGVWTAWCVNDDCATTCVDAEGYSREEAAAGWNDRQQPARFRRPSPAGSTAVLNEAINDAHAEAIRLQAEHGVNDSRAGFAVGKLEGLQLAKLLVQQQP